MQLTKLDKIKDPKLGRNLVKPFHPSEIIVQNLVKPFHVSEIILKNYHVHRWN